MNSKVFRRTFCLFLLLSVAVLSGCERTQQVIQPVTAAESLSGEIRIGVVLPRTGDLGPGEFGPGALVMENSFKMALEEINASSPPGETAETGHWHGDVWHAEPPETHAPADVSQPPAPPRLSGRTLKFIIEDDMSTVDGAVAAFNKLIHQDKVPVILGVWTSHVARSVFPIAQENEVVAFSPVVIASGLTDIGDFIFRASHPTEALIPGGVALTQAKLGYQRVALISDSIDTFSRDSDAVFRKTLTEHGVEVLSGETFETGATDFTPQLTRIKALDPDAIFVSAQQREVIQILKQGREIGISADTPFISLVLSIDEIQSAGEAAEGAITFTDWVSTAQTPGNEAFVANYTAKYGMEPSVWAAQPYAAVYILAEAIRNATSTDSIGIRNALAEIQEFDTILGKFSFDANGDPIYDPVVLVVKDGNLEVFK